MEYASHNCTFIVWTMMQLHQAYWNSLKKVGRLCWGQTSPPSCVREEKIQTVILFLKSDHNSRNWRLNWFRPEGRKYVAWVTHRGPSDSHTYCHYYFKFLPEEVICATQKLASHPHIWHDDRYQLTHFGLCMSFKCWLTNSIQYPCPSSTSAISY